MPLIRSSRRRPRAGEWTLAAIAAAAIVSGCGGGPAVIPPSLDRAEVLLRQGDDAGAARVYEQLARQNSGAHRNDLVFAAAHAYLAARLPDDAARVSTLLEQPLTPEQGVQRDLLEAQTSLTRGQYDQAWQRINAINPPRAPTLAVRYYRLKQNIALASGRLVAAVAAEDELEPWLPGVTEIRASRGQLLDALRQATERGVKVEPKSTKDAVTRAWLELGPLAMTASRDPAGTTALVQAWLARHPAHPASESVRSQLLQHQPPPPPPQEVFTVPGAAPVAAPPTRVASAGTAVPGVAQAQPQPLPEAPAAVPGTAAAQAAGQPVGAAPAPAAPPPPLSPPVQGETVIALLLPVEGRTAAAATIVRDGFMAAYYQTPTAQRPRVRLYDTSGTGISETIGRAVQEGATFIVGPLTREEVTAAAELSGTHPPVLALNFLAADHPVPGDFYQYALSPENEARLAAHRILDDGHRQGVALVPRTDWGTRVLAAFKQEIEAGGGSLMAAATVDTTETDFSDGITQVLRINESKARAKRLEQILGAKLQFEPRRRADIDYIFTPAQPALERMLRPQLRFHYAGSIPTYATSEAYEADPHANQDLEGLIFPDMPWMLGTPQAEVVRTAAQQAWPTGGAKIRNRLFAFGYDAYKLALGLRAATGMVSIEGLTGRLTLDSEHRVHRDLSWLQVHNGEARLLPAGGQAQASAP
jgi:outer membrane PBP1 activator LpoA protein